jgi:hypothetical protein
MPYVLVVLLAVSMHDTGGGMMQEFSSQERCEAAKQVIVKAANDATDPKFRSDVRFIVCLPK